MARRTATYCLDCIVLFGSLRAPARARPGGLRVPFQRAQRHPCSRSSPTKLYCAEAVPLSCHLLRPRKSDRSSSRSSSSRPARSITPAPGHDHKVVLSVFSIRPAAFVQRGVDGADPEGGRSATEYRMSRSPRPARSSTFRSRPVAIGRRRRRDRKLRLDRRCRSTASERRCWFSAARAISIRTNRRWRNSSGAWR